MTSDTLNSDNHFRTIIHIDLDCFYAQVEMIKKPELRNVPLGIQQKNIVVTSNYLARDNGVQKCMLISEALKLCPQLTLVKGEDLYDYRQMSAKVTDIIQKFTPLVEKLGLDENYADVTELVKDRLNTDINSNIQAVGHIYGSQNENCECGCFDRLNIGSIIASEIRKRIKTELGLTSCAGIAHNKLLAKLGGASHKPDQQTIVYPSNAAQFLSSLSNIKSIPGIGQSAFEVFKLHNIKTVEDLRECSLERLQKLFGKEKARLYMEWAYGIDNSAVKVTGKPQSIGLEDSCRSISVEKEAKEKFRLLLHRLMVLVSEDGRIPKTLKVTLRKFDAQKKVSHREQRQCNVSPSLFTVNSCQLSPNSEEKLMTSIMHLFHKLVDISKPFYVTLLGLAFTKFQERQNGKNSIASYLLKNLSVQSVTTLENSIESMDCGSVSPIVDNTDGSESEIEPSPKKTKLANLITKRRLDATVECPSPSKLRVAELRLNSREAERPPEETCPKNVDPEVFKELPIDVQRELINQWQIQSKMSRPPLIKKPKTNTLLTYFIKK